MSRRPHYQCTKYPSLLAYILSGVLSMLGGLVTKIALRNSISQIIVAFVYSYAHVKEYNNIYIIRRLYMQMASAVTV